MGRGRRRGGGSAGRGNAALLGGAFLAIGGLFLPWVEVDADGPLPVLARGLSAAGLLPDTEAVFGYEIPGLVRDAAASPLVRAGRTAGELVSGRMDRAAACVLFGDEGTGDQALLVLGPAALGALNLLRLRFRARQLAALFAAADAAAFAAALVVAIRIPGASEDVSLTILAGIPVTLAGLLILALSSLRAFLSQGR